VIFGEKAVNYTEGKFVHVDGLGMVFRPDFETEMVRAGDMQGYIEFGDKPEYHYGSFLTGTAVRGGDAQDIFRQQRENVSSLLKTSRANCGFLTKKSDSSIGMQLAWTWKPVHSSSSVAVSLASPLLAL